LLETQDICAAGPFVVWVNKKQKQEEDKMRTNEESFSTQSKRLKEKLRSVAQGGRQAGKEGGRSK